MPDISPINSLQGGSVPASIQRAQIDAPAAATPKRAEIHDRVEISEHARHLEKLRQTPDVRQAKIDAARTEIAQGTYETPDRLRAALLRLLDEIDPSQA
ncbi:MAG: flagellar biosynthesis anti-sigma factor FlgM [Planctomycetes bacterium]|nr:flagellar biosynthesis anti-sigma factor FlgM [Planctomycetota bacterium]